MYSNGRRSSVGALCDSGYLTKLNIHASMMKFFVLLDHQNTNTDEIDYHDSWTMKAEKANKTNETMRICFPKKKIKLYSLCNCRTDISLVIYMTVV